MNINCHCQLIITRGCGVSVALVIPEAKAILRCFPITLFFSMIAPKYTRGCMTWIEVLLVRVMTSAFGSMTSAVTVSSFQISSQSGHWYISQPGNSFPPFPPYRKST